MKTINYTSLTNEKGDVAIIINPLKISGNMNFFEKNNNDLIIEINRQKFELLDFFKNHRGIKKFILVEYGPYGLINEKKIRLS